MVMSIITCVASFVQLEFAAIAAAVVHSDVDYCRRHSLPPRSTIGCNNVRLLFATACIVCRAGSMSRYRVRPSVCLSVPLARCSNVRRVCCCAPGGQEISIDCYTAGALVKYTGSRSCIISTLGYLDI